MWTITLPQKTLKLIKEFCDTLQYKIMMIRKIGKFLMIMCMDAVLLKIVKILFARFFLIPFINVFLLKLCSIQYKLQCDMHVQTCRWLSSKKYWQIGQHALNNIIILNLLLLHDIVPPATYTIV